MNDNGHFKSSLFGGFKKANVLEYLSKLQSEHSVQISDLERKVLDINEERNKFADLVQINENKLKEIEKKITGDAGVIPMLKEKTGLLMDSEYLVQKQQKEIERIRLECKTLISDLEIHSIKSRKYDEINSKIGETFVEAQRQSKNILDKSVAKAEEISRQTEESMAEIAGKVYTSKKTLLNLRQDVDDIYNAFKTQIEGLESSMDTVISTLQTDKVHEHVMSFYATEELDKISEIDSFKQIIMPPESSPQKVTIVPDIKNDVTAFFTQIPEQKKQIPDSDFNLPKDNNLIRF